MIRAKPLMPVHCTSVVEAESLLELAGDPTTGCCSWSTHRWGYYAASVQSALAGAAMPSLVVSRTSRTSDEMRATVTGYAFDVD